MNHKEQVSNTNTSINDFPKSKDDKKPALKLDEKTMNLVFGCMIIVTVLCTGLMLYYIEDFSKSLIDARPEYKFPKMSDFSLVLKIFPFLFISKILIEKFSKPFCEKYLLSSKYTNKNDQANYLLGRIYLNKQTTNIYKFTYYLCVTIFGYIILCQLDYFPVELGGSGYIDKMWEAGLPDSLYHWKPEYFDVYYLTGLAFCLTDLIWLVFIYELQSDFIMMLLHHFCTISLITFSFCSNYSNVGCIVLFLHDFGDIFVYFARIVVNIEIKFLVILAGVLLIPIFIYTRIYIFFNVLLSLWRGVTWEWNWISKSLFWFLCFLFVMHVNWVYLILQKFMKAIFKDKFEDTAKYEKKEFKNK